MRPERSWRVPAACAPALALAFLTACATHGPQDTFDPAGPDARTIQNLFIPVLIVAALVFVFVEGLLVVTMVRWRHRRRADRMPTQVHGNTKLEMAWTIAPAFLLGLVAIPTLGTIFSLASRPVGPDVLNVNVVARQFWWEASYPGLGVVTANVIHIPVGRQVYVKLESVDVIHSFWVPRLAGKQDVVPGRVNYLKIEADAAGRYSAQCAEYCGASHANMRFEVLAQSQADFDAWVAEESLPVAAQPPQEVLDVMTRTGCQGCHAIDGVEAAGFERVEGLPGKIGPDLTHFAGRECFAGCFFENTPEELAVWLADPPARKPGVDMPDLGLSEREVQILVDYLEGLR